MRGLLLPVCLILSSEIEIEIHDFVYFNRNRYGNACLIRNYFVLQVKIIYRV